MPRKPGTPKKPPPLWFTDGEGRRYLIAQFLDEEMVYLASPTIRQTGQLKKVATWCKNAETYMRYMRALRLKRWKDTP